MIWWAVLLYVFNASALMGAFIIRGVAASMDSRIDTLKVDFTAGLGGLLFGLIGFVAIYQLTIQSASDYAILFGVLYATISGLWFVKFILEWMKGYVGYGRMRFALVILSSIVGIVLVSLLAFTG